MWIVECNERLPYWESASSGGTQNSKCCSRVIGIRAWCVGLDDHINSDAHPKSQVSKVFCGFRLLCPCSCEVVLLGTDNMGLGRYIRNGVQTVSAPCSVLSPRNFEITMQEAAITSTSFSFPNSLFQLSCSTYSPLWLVFVSGMPWVQT